jgi:hypothetical protein
LFLRSVASASSVPSARAQDFRSTTVIAALLDVDAAHRKHEGYGRTVRLKALVFAAGCLRVYLVASLALS